MKKTAVLLLAYGGPDSLDDVPAYLRDVRGGQPVSQILLDETIRRYRLIGGRSPLLDITRRLASKLQSAIDLPVYVGMRHWHPYIAETAQEMMCDGIDHIVAICLAPHYSSMSIGVYRKRLDEAIALCHCEEHRETESNDATKQSPKWNLEIASQRPLAMTIPTFVFIDSWHTQARYIEGIANNVRVALAQLSSDAIIIFTAHCLPVSVREPYESQLRETARLVAHNLGLREDRWMLCYQSKPRASVDWLEPQIENVVPQLARDGEKHLVIAPIGFLADHLEVLFDIDIAAQDLARENGARLVRTPMLNDSDALVNALAELVEERVTNHVSRITGDVIRDA